MQIPLNLSVLLLGVSLAMHSQISYGYSKPHAKSHLGSVPRILDLMAQEVGYNSEETNDFINTILSEQKLLGNNAFAGDLAVNNASFTEITPQILKDVLNKQYILILNAAKDDLTDLRRGRVIEIPFWLKNLSYERIASQLNYEDEHSIKTFYSQVMKLVVVNAVNSPAILSDDLRLDNIIKRCEEGIKHPKNAQPSRDVKEFERVFNEFNQASRLPKSR